VKKVCSLLAQVLAVTVSAAPLPSVCIKRLPTGKIQEPLTFASLRACQKRETDAVTDSIFSGVITTASIKDFKSLDDRHLAEQADWKSRHPGAETAEVPPPAPPRPAAPIQNAARPADPTAPIESIARSPEERMSPEMAQAIKDFGIKK
jgi:hypothetical protein